MKNTIKKATMVTMLMAAMLLAMPGTDAQAATMRISKTSITLKIGKSKTLKMKNATGKVKWKTSKKSVATVTQKGKVTAKKAGKAFIQAKVSGRTYECRVTVKGAAKKTDAGNAVSTDANAAGTENTDVTDTDTNTDSAGTGTSATDTQTTTEDTQPDKTETTPAHEHTWVPHYTYGADGKPYKDAMFCSDVTCPYNNGYGTDNGWRGESLTGSTGTETTEPSQGTAVQQPATPVTDNTDNTQDTVTNEPSVTEPAATENPVQEEQPKEEHHHAWTIPVLSDDKLTVTGYACACGEKAEHDHEWTEAVYRTEGYGAGHIVECYKCPCGETITAEGYATLCENNKKVSKEIMDNWVTQNITTDMTDLQKAKAILRETNSWTYGINKTYTMSNVARVGDCLSSARMFVSYCEKAGVKAEAFDATKMLGVEKHWMAYVWIDGEQCVVDPTAGYGYFPGKAIKAEGFDLYCDYLDGYVTDEEFDQQIAAYEM